MDVNSNLLRLKLDMVYRDLSVEEGQKKFAELTQTVPPVVETSKPKPKKKVIKTIVVKK
jgi:hypothetical protein